jgi:hypothetical protein
MMTTTTNTNRDWLAKDAGSRVVAVRDTTTWSGHPVKAGTMGTLKTVGPDLDGALQPGEIVVTLDGVDRICAVRDWDFPTTNELYIDSGLADHARFQLDGDGIALDLFTPGTRTHISGRRLNPAQIQDLLQWLADHGHTLDEGDKPKPEPTTGHGTAYVFGMVPEGVDQRRYHGFLREGGSFAFFDDTGAFSYALPSQYDGFEPDTKDE